MSTCWDCSKFGVTHSNLRSGMSFFPIILISLKTNIPLGAGIWTVNFEQFQFSTWSQEVLGRYFIDVKLWVNWSKDENFWERITCKRSSRMKIGKKPIRLRQKTVTCKSILFQPFPTSSKPKGKPGTSIAVWRLDNNMGKAKIKKVQITI